MVFYVQVLIFGKKISMQQWFTAYNLQFTKLDHNMSLLRGKKVWWD